VIDGLEFSFYSSTPGVLGLPSLPLPLRCPVKGYAGDVAWLSSDVAHAVLVTAGEKMLFGDGLGTENSQDSFKKIKKVA